MRLPSRSPRVGATPLFSANGAVPQQSAMPSQLAQLGGALQQAGSTAFGIVDERQRQLNLSRIKEADNRAADLFREHMGAYLATRGKDATGQNREQTFSRLEESLRSVADGLDNEEQSARYWELVEDRMVGARTRADSHETEQVRIDAIGQTEARIESALVDAVAAVGTDEYEYHRQIMLGEVDERLRLDGIGEDDPRRRVARLDWTTKLHAATVRSLLQSGQVNNAAAHLQSAGDEIDPVTKAQLQGMLGGEQAKRAGMKVADELRQAGGSVREQLAEIERRQAEGKLTLEQGEHARKFVLQFDRDAAALTERERNRVTQRFEQLLGQNPLLSVEQLDPTFLAEIDGLYLRGDFEKAAAQARARVVGTKDTESLTLSRDINSLRTLDNLIEDAEQKATSPIIAPREGQEDTRAQQEAERQQAQQRLKVLHAMRDRLNASMSRFLNEGDPADRPLEDMLLELDREARGTLFSPGGFRPTPRATPQQRPAQEPQQGQEQGRAPAPQQPDAEAVAEPLFGRAEPPDNFRDMLARALKARADSLKPDIFDDQGRLVSEGRHTDEAALLAAGQHFQAQLRMGYADDWRRYFATGQLPDGWIADTAVQQSPETYARNRMAEVTEQARQESPALSALRDYFVDPAGRILPAASQVVSDLAFGAAGLIGIETPADKDIEAGVYAASWGAPKSVARAMLEGQRKGASVPAQIVGGAGQMVGIGLGFLATGPKQVLAAGGKLLGGIGKALFGRAGEVVGHSAGAFGAYEALAASGERGQPATAGERLTAAGHGVAAGAALGLAHNIVSFGLRGMFRADVRSLAPTEKQAMEALEKWGKANKILPLANESLPTYEKRLIDAWIGAGLPGAKPVAWKQLAGRSMRAGADGLGFSLLDQEFVRDLTEAAQGGNEGGFQRALTKLLGNTLGAAVLHMRLSDIPLWQRQQRDPVRRQEPEPAPQEPRPQEPAAEPGPTTFETPERARPRPEPVTDERFGAGVLADLGRLGWQVETTAGEGLGVPGVAEAFVRLEGDRAVPSKALRQMFDLPENIPAADAASLLVDGSLVSAMRAKATLPGTEVSADGIWVEPGKGENPSMARTIRMGRLYEAEWGPDMRWKPAKELPANKPADFIEPEQQAVVDRMREILNSRVDLAHGTRMLLDEAVNVLGTVSRRNNRAVEETLGAVEEVLPLLATGSRTDAHLAARTLGEMLTTKTPEIAMEPLRARVEEIRAEAEQPVPFGEGVFEQRPGERENAEGGFVDIRREDLDRIANVVTQGAAEVGGPLRRIWDAFQRSRIQEAEDVGLRDLAESGRKATTATHGFRARLTEAGLYDLRRLPRRDLDSFAELKPDGMGGFADRYSRAMDKGIAEHFGEVRDLSPAEQKVVDLGRKVFLEAGRIAEEVGVVNERGEPFRVDPERLRLTRQWTPEARHARDEKGGKLHDAIVDWIERKYGIDRAEALERFQDSASVTRQDATETTRKLPVLPTHVEVDGRPVRILESRPLEHTEALAFTNAQVMGARSVLPVRQEKPPEDTQTYETPAGLDALPPVAQQVLDRILTEKGRTAADSAAKLIRAMHGMEASPRDLPFQVFRPGEPGYHLGRVLGAGMGLMRSGLLTMSFLRNLAEPFANAAHFGTVAVGRAYRNTVRAFASGELRAEHRRLVEEGWMADSALNDPWRGENLMETWEASMKKVGDLLTTPLRLSQDFNEIINAAAARERLEAMKKKEGIAADRSALKLLGFSQAEATRMMRGEGTPEQYERYQKGIVGALAGGKSLTPAERSAAGSSAQFNSIVWFTNFFQGRARAIDSLARDFITERENRLENFTQLVKFAGFQVVSGAIGSAFIAFVRNGGDGVQDYIREQVAGATPEERAQNVASSALHLLVNGLLGGVGDPLSRALSGLGEAGSTREQVQEGLRVLGPLSTAWQGIDFLRALALDADVPGYEGMSALEKVGKYLQASLPAAKTMHEGLFGISAIAFTDKNPQLDAAQDSFWRWMRDEGRIGSGTFHTAEENRAFRDAMRKVVDRVHALEGFSDGELMHELLRDEAFVDAVVGAEAAQMLRAEARGERPSFRDAAREVASSLRRRKILPSEDSTAWTPEDRARLEAHLGEKNLAMLRAYDATLDAIAKQIARLNVRGAVSERFEAGRR